MTRRCEAWGCHAALNPRRRRYCSEVCATREARGVRAPRKARPYGEVHDRMAALVADVKRRLQCG